MRDGLLILALIAVIFILFCTRPAGAGSSTGTEAVSVNSSVNVG